MRIDTASLESCLHGAARLLTPIPALVAEVLRSPVRTQGVMFDTNPDAFRSPPSASGLPAAGSSSSSSI